MSQRQHRRLRRLEKLAGPSIERVKQKDKAFLENVKLSAEVHAYNFAAVVLYGNPKIGEPLSLAWERCRGHLPDLQRITWTLKFPQPLADEAAKILKEPVNTDLPGSTQMQKLQGLFDSAPPWLIWFTFADWTVEELDLKLPDLSIISNFERCNNGIGIWPGLPSGTFELKPLDRDRPALDMSIRDFYFLRERLGAPAEQMTRLERKRYEALYLKFLLHKEALLGLSSEEGSFDEPATQL